MKRKLDEPVCETRRDLGLLSILLLALTLAACAVQEPQPDAPLPSPPPSPPTSVEPAAPGLDVVATDADIQNRRDALLRSDDAISSEAAGYFMDVFRARVRQDLSDTGIMIDDRDRSILVTFPDDIGFESGSAQLTAEAMLLMDKLAGILREYRAILIVVSGHTDDIGERQFNYRLSQRRARSAAQHLSAAGVSTTRLLIRGFGPDQPLASNQTEEGRARNRRFELLLEVLVRDEAVPVAAPETA